MSTRGRPTLYKPENAELARKFCMLGATNEDLADLFDVDLATQRSRRRPVALLHKARTFTHPG